MSQPEALSFATGARDPWCPGCGHTLLVAALRQALAARFDPHDVVLVTDIGCIGMADGLFCCHTVHGLHGRAPALAAGIAMSSPRPGMKVLALLGDGGAAIGLQHLLECARLNVDVTLVVANNLNYGMTGGQQSAYTLPGVRTSTSPRGASVSAYDLCALFAPFDVPRARVLATARETLQERLGAALDHRGCALVEVLDWCPSYAGKLNPDTVTPRGMEALFSAQGRAPGTWVAEAPRPVFQFRPTREERVPERIAPAGGHRLRGRVQMVLAGSAGRGVQSAAEVFARAAIRSGLHVALRSEYPVTVGKGFSASELCLSERPIGSLASERWDLAMACSQDGWAWLRDHVASADRIVLDAALPNGTAPEPGPLPVDPTGVGALPHRVSRLWLAEPRHHGYRALPATVEPPAPSRSAPRVERVDFARGDPKGAAFAALCWALADHGWFDLAFLRSEVERMPDGGPRRSLLTAIGG